MSTGKERKRAGIYRLCLLVMLILLLGATVPVSAKVTSVKNIEKVTGGRFTARNGNWYYYDKDGQMAKDCLLSVRGKTYYFSAKVQLAQDRYQVVLLWEEIRRIHV